MLNSLRDGQMNYGTTNFTPVHVPPHNVVAPIHQNSLISTEPAASVYPWNSNPRLEHLYGFHSRYYNLDFPTSYPSTTNQYVPPNMYSQNLPQCCQPCCRLRSQNIPKTSPQQMLYNPVRPVQQLNRPYKSKKTLKTPCSDQFLPYIPNDFPVKYDTQNCYQQKYNNSYLNNTNYCPPANNLWIPPAANTTWSTDRLRPLGRHTNITSHDFSRNKNYQRLPNYQNNLYSNSTSTRPYNYMSPISTDVHDYRPSSVYHNLTKNNTSEYISHENNSRISVSSQNNQSLPSSQQYYNAQSVPFPDLKRHGEPFKPPHVASQNLLKNNLNVREFLANWDEGEEEISEKTSEVPAPIVVLDCMTLEGDALSKVQEKLNVVSYENLEKVLKENQNPLIINAEPIIEVDSLHSKAKQSSKPNFEPLDYTKRETGIIKPFINEKKTSPETDVQSEKSYSVNFDGMVAWYGKKNTDISSTDLIERLADRIFNLSKSQENKEVSFGTAAYTGQITQTNKSITNSVKDSSKYIQSQQLFDLQNHAEKCIEPSVINKINGNNDIPRIHSCVLNESDKASSDIKSNNLNSSCIVENITKKYFDVTNEQTTPWNLEQGTQEQHLNLSLYDHSVIIKPLDFSSLTDESKCNPFAFEKNTSNSDKPNDGINNQFNKVLSENNNYNTTVSNNQHSIQQIDYNNRNFPVIVSPHNSKQNYNVFHESVIQRTGCDKNKHDKVSTHTDFDGINWNMSNDFDKIIKNTNISMEPSCLYDRNNYNILDSMNEDKNISTQWKNNIPCIDLTVNSKTNSSHDSFFDSWNFIESYDNNSNKKIINSPSNNNEADNSLYTNQITTLEESSNKRNSVEKAETELITVKNIPFSKINDMTTNNIRSRDVFNLNNRIPDFSDGFELPVINESHDYMQFKKSSNDSENRTDGSIFEHLTEPKYARTNNDLINAKTDQQKSDIVGLPSFKDKDPLAPMSVPPKLNIVKPIIRDPSQVYTVIKQKLKYNNACVNNNNNNNMVSNKTGNSLRENETNTFYVTDLKSKYNNLQLNQYDVWSEKFVLKGHSKNSSTSTVQCDVEITQFKSTPENRNILIPKLNVSENYQDKNTKLPENTGCNLTVNKNNVMENVKIHSNDFLNCLDNTKTNDQKYRDTLDEFETSFGFDIHCNNESNKSFHEEIVDKCLEERIKDQIDGNSMNTSNGNITSSDNTQLPFHCDFQSSYLIKSYFDESKNKTDTLDQNQSNSHKKSDTTTNFNFELHNIHTTQNLKENVDFSILNNSSHNIEEIPNVPKDNNSNMNKTKLNHSFVLNHDNINKISNIEKNNFDYLTLENRNFEFENNKKCISELTNSKEINAIKNLSKANNNSKISHSSFSNTQKSLCDNFELNINNINMFETNSNKSKTRINGLEHNKNSFESTFHPVNEENIEHHNKNVFELENNNSDLKNLDKIHGFDFNNKTIQTFEIDYSQNNVHKLISPTKVFTDDNQIKINYNYNINNKEIHFKNTPYIPKVPQTEKILVLDNNDNTQLQNIIETNDMIPDDKIILEDRFKAKEIEKNQNSKMNINNCNTHENSKNNINYDVENIFENLYENLSTLNTEKNNSSNCCQSDISNNLRNNEDQNLKVNDFVDDKIVKRTDIYEDLKSDKVLGKTNTALLQEFVNNSVSRLSSFPLRLCKPLMEESSVKLSAGDTKELNEYIISNKNENLLNISNNSNVYKDTTMLKKQEVGDIKQIEIESINQNNIQNIKYKADKIIQGDVTNKKIDMIKSDLLNTETNINTTQDEENIQNNNSELSSISYEKLTDQPYYNEIISIKDLSISEHNLKNNIELKHLNSNDTIKDSPDSKQSSINHTKLTYQQNSSNIVKDKDSLTSEISQGKFVELLRRLNSNTIVENKDLSNYAFGSLNPKELIHQQHHNEMNTIKESTISESSSLNQIKLISQQNSNETMEIEASHNFELTHQQHSNVTVELENPPKIEPILINHGESIYQQNHNEINVIKDLSIPEHDSVNQTKLHNSNGTIKVKDLPKSEPILINHNELMYQQNHNEIDMIKDSSISECCSTYQAKLQNSNETIEVEDLSKFKSVLKSHDGFIQQQHYNETVEVEDLPKIEPTLIKHGELICQQNHNEMDVINNSLISEHSLVNQTKLENSNETVEVEDLPNTESISINHSELIYQQNHNEINVIIDSPVSEHCSVNQTKLQNSNETIEVEGSPKIESGLISHGKVTEQQHCNKTVEVEDSPKIESISINHDELLIHHDILCQQNHDKIDVIKDSSKYKSSSIVQAKIIRQEHSNETVKIKDLPKFESAKPGLIRHNELILPQNCNEIVEGLSKIETVLINHNESTYKQTHNEIIDVKDSQISEPNLLINSELPYKHANRMVEIENISNCGYSSLNHVELTCQPNCDNIIHNEYLTILKSSSPNDLLSTKQQHEDETLKCSTNIEMTKSSEDNVKFDNEYFFKNIYSKNVVDNIKLPRVKFILKCHNKNIKRTNIFDDNPVVPSKNLNVIKEDYLVDRDYCKNQNRFYKPWRKNFYKKKSIDKPKENEIEMVEVTNIRSYNLAQNIKSSDFNTEVKYDDNVASLSSTIYSNEKEQCIEQESNVVDDEIHKNTSGLSVFDEDPHESFVGEVLTPMPSPCNDFESDSQFCEQYGEEFWDKSLENEYKNVLRKTISSLVKNRVSLRDRFDTRLLARKVNVSKRRKRHRQRRKSIKMEVARPQIHDSLIVTENIELVKLSELSQTDPMRCMIKVQLPWGRIFNLNDQNRLEDGQGNVKDTKIELGPAKVEVRLSQTPGEWQVAACQSITSSKSVVSVKRLVLQREATGDAVNVYDECCSSVSHSSDTSAYSGNCVLRKLPKIVIRRNGRNNNYTSYVSSSEIDEGGDIVDRFPRLMVRLVRDRNLDAMAADGVTTVQLKHVVPINAAESVVDTHDAKRTRYA